MKFRLFSLVLALVLCLSTSALAQTQVSSTIHQWQYATLAYRNNVLIVRESFDVGYALFDANGQAITSNDYRFINEWGKLFKVAKESGVNCYGLIDAAGREIAPMQYGDFLIVSDRWYVGIVLEPAAETDYDYYTFGTGDTNYFLVARYDVYFDGALIGSLDRAGLNWHFCTAHGAYLIAKNTNGDFFALDSAFRSPERVPELTSEYQEVLDFGANRWIIYHTGSGLPAFTADCTLTPDDVDCYLFASAGQVLDLQGNAVGSIADYEYIYHFDGNYAYAMNAEGKCAIIDATGYAVVPAVLDNTENTGIFACGYEAVSAEGKLCWASPEDGIVYVSDVPSETTHVTSGAFISYKAEDGRYALITPLGKLPNTYADIGRFTGSTARVMAVFNDDKAGVIGMAGEDIIPADGTYDSLFDLSVSYDGTVVLASMGYIDDQNTFAVYTIAYDAEGLALEQPEESPAVYLESVSPLIIP